MENLNIKTTSGHSFLGGFSQFFPANIFHFLIKWISKLKKKIFGKKFCQPNDFIFFRMLMQISHSFPKWETYYNEGSFCIICLLLQYISFTVVVQCRQKISSPSKKIIEVFLHTLCLYGKLRLSGFGFLSSLQHLMIFVSTKISFMYTVKPW